MTNLKKHLTHTNEKQASVYDINSDTILQAESFYQMLSKSDYYRTEKRGFISGYEMDDWAKAELEIQASQKENLAT
ncbi:MAG: DUF2934 domain-containing protein [Methyloprofundus sp.]|nr:DUF2934 domain-containing protein [Methyloprofundus sp.]